jgi:tetratricopeptide (TPR) repeat protein
MKRRLRAAPVCALALLALCAPGIIRAHDSPEHVVEALTARMAREGKTASLLYRRAVEYRALGKSDRAAGDLLAALKADRAYLPAHRELCLVRLAEGRNGEALAAIDRAIGLVPGERERAPLYMARARVRYQSTSAAWCRKARSQSDSAAAALPPSAWTRAREEFRAAIAEMDPRIRPETPDLMLVADRGLAYALLGDRAQAGRDLAAARAGGIDSWVTHRLEVVLAILDRAFTPSGQRL